MPIDLSKFHIDIQDASKDELKKIQGVIMGRLVHDVHLRATDEVAYNSHGSNHTNHSDASIREQLKNAGNVTKVGG